MKVILFLVYAQCTLRELTCLKQCMTAYQLCGLLDQVKLRLNLLFEFYKDFLELKLARKKNLLLFLFTYLFHLHIQN